MSDRDDRQEPDVEQQQAVAQALCILRHPEQERQRRRAIAGSGRRRAWDAPAAKRGRLRLFYARRFQRQLISRLKLGACSDSTTPGQVRAALAQYLIDKHWAPELGGPFDLTDVCQILDGDLRRLEQALAEPGLLAPQRATLDRDVAEQRLALALLRRVLEA